MHNKREKNKTQEINEIKNRKNEDMIKMYI